MKIEKLDILAFGAHPDDVELGCSGTLYSLYLQGKKVGIIDFTKGELGTRGTEETRKIEADNAKNILQIEIRENLGFPDGFFENTKAYQLKIIEKIRMYKPEIVLCNAVLDRHPDHGKASKLVSDSCFLSGLKKIETQYNAWRPKHIFHYIQWENLKPDFCIDISHTIDKKVESCLAYKTQFYDENSSEQETPITSKNFLESIKYRAQDLGRLVGVDYAEGFTTEKYPTFINFDGFI